jgi:hypothetical protein
MACSILGKPKSWLESDEGGAAYWVVNADSAQAIIWLKADFAVAC